MFAKLCIRLFLSCTLMRQLACSTTEGQPTWYSTKSVEELSDDYEQDKNSMLAIIQRDNEALYEDFYDESDNSYLNTSRDSMNIIFFGEPVSFLRLDPESIMHIFSHVKTHLVPTQRALLAWDLMTDGKTAAFLQYRSYLALGRLLNVIPEEDLFYVNFADAAVLKFFAVQNLKLQPRKLGVLVTAYRRYYGNRWFLNGTYINDLGYLICGFPAADLRLISPRVFKEVNLDVLNKISSCSEAQVQALYHIATNEDAHGPPYRWTSHEISRLSMLLTCIPDSEISSIQLEAVTAISEEVMKQINQRKLVYFTKQQVLRMHPKTRRIFLLRMQLRTSLDMTQLTRKASGVVRPWAVVCLLGVFTTQSLVVMVS